MSNENEDKDMCNPGEDKAFVGQFVNRNSPLIIKIINGTSSLAQFSKNNEMQESSSNSSQLTLNTFDISSTPLKPYLCKPMFAPEDNSCIIEPTTSQEILPYCDLPDEITNDCTSNICPPASDNNRSLSTRTRRRISSRNSENVSSSNLPEASFNNSSTRKKYKRSSSQNSENISSSNLPEASYDNASTSKKYKRSSSRNSENVSCSNLPEASYNRCTSMENNDDNSMAECSICHDSYVEIVSSDRDFMSTVCGHLFCSLCIQSSLMDREICPRCLRKIYPKQVHPIFL
ncbi:hypothetical protein CDAR_203521 [Caerostris darwini]|uniref:RING-type domain-containing protein n=1 Tax=Caerostris darwini TaxID=1538125 RepID=A0AAV4VIC8_9ARAC|nr:hypothetical protein CDAR_203521 [Caerostris darwini]